MIEMTENMKKQNETHNRSFSSKMAIMGLMIVKPFILNDAICYEL